MFLGEVSGARCATMISSIFKIFHYMEPYMMRWLGNSTSRSDACSLDINIDLIHVLAMFTRSLVKFPLSVVQRNMFSAIPTMALAVRGFKSSTTQLQQTQMKEPIIQHTPLTTTPGQSLNVPDLTPLKFEKDIYASLRIHNRQYLVTEGDEVILPFRMIHAEIGDVLNFNDVTTIGSKNFTYHADPIDPSVVSIKAVITEKTKKPMYTKEVTKRRNRHVKHHKVKHDITILRITELKLNV